MPVTHEVASSSLVVPELKKAANLLSGFFNFRMIDAKTPKLEFGARALRAEELSLEQAELVKRKSVDPLNATEQDTSLVVPAI